MLEAWAPFGSGATGCVSDPAIATIAAKHGKNTGQVILRWLFQRKIVSLPKSSSEARMKGNLDIMDFEWHNLSKRIALISKSNNDDWISQESQPNGKTGSLKNYCEYDTITIK